MLSAARTLQLLPVLLHAPGVASACDRCTTADTTGAFDGTTFRPASGCAYAVPSVRQTAALLRGRWIFTCGGSNAWVLAANLACVRRSRYGDPWDVPASPCPCNFRSIY